MKLNDKKIKQLSITEINLPSSSSEHQNHNYEMGLSGAYNNTLNWNNEKKRIGTQIALLRSYLDQ